MRIYTIKRRLGVVLAIAAVLVAPVLSTNGVSAATTYCGSACNGKATSYHNCANSAHDIGQAFSYYYPTAYTGAVDKYLRVQFMYSTNCQTMWARITNLKAIGRTSCTVYLGRQIAPYYNLAWNHCDAVGGSYTDSVMIDDHGGANAALIRVAEGINNLTYIASRSY
jgi:hypothetical protein